MSAVKIVSAAQHAMFTRAASDPAYAKERGILQALAQEAIDAHEKEGKPHLPDRVSASVPMKRGAKDSSRPDRPKYLTYPHAD